MNEIPLPTRYHLRSRITGKIFPDDKWMLDAPDELQPSLLESVYDKKCLEIKSDAFGIYKFADWMPVHRILQGSSAPVTYKSEGLARHLGMKNLWITFSGYWPERGAFMRTCSFKETEAYSVCARLRSDQKKILVVASAGNTARAFARVCSDNQIPLLLSVPYDTLDALWFDTPLDHCVTLISPPATCDYFDAIHLSNLVCQLDGFIPEGGAKNIARRDGMATTVLSATTSIGVIPAYYFQAVGSGTGAIAAWEANFRLLRDGRFGKRKMKLWLSQNCPFHPMVDAWKVRSRNLLPMEDQKARELVGQIGAKVLSNRRPPYPISGGLYDALIDTEGEMEMITNDQASDASALFMKLEGIDIHPAAAVAAASLIDAIRKKRVPSDEVIMLNITGGGEEKLKKHHKNLVFLKPAFIAGTEISREELRKKLKEIF